MPSDFDIKIFFSFLGIITIIIGYSHYIIWILKGKIKPHIFSWFFWWILTLTGFFIQISDNPWPWAWVTFWTAIVSLFIALISIKWWFNYIKRSDVIALLWGFFTFFTWMYFQNIYFSLGVLIISDLLGYFPTIRKSYFSPFEESPFTFFLAWLKFFFAILALDTFSVATILYPLYLLIMGWWLSFFILIRQYQLKK